MQTAAQRPSARLTFQSRLRLSYKDYKSVNRMLVATISFYGYFAGGDKKGEYEEGDNDKGTDYERYLPVHVGGQLHVNPFI